MSGIRYIHKTITAAQTIQYNVMKRCKSSSSSQRETSFLGDLKVRVVQSIADSLPAEERERLIMSIGPGYVERKSVGEAVAAAMAKEQEFRMEWVEKIEEAAKERIELEQQLRSTAEKELVQMKETLAKNSKGNELIAEEDDTSLGGNQLDIQTQAIDFHPVLGELIADLGYKRVYLTKTQNLSAIPIWEKQRAYRHARAKVIAREKLKRKQIGLPGVITLFEGKLGDLSILDGQHRVGMLTILDHLSETKKDGLLFDLERILVEVFPDVTSDGENMFAADLFSDINKAEPIKIIDLPGEADREILKMINPVAETIEKMFPEMFKPNARCLPPHLNVDNFRTMLYIGEVMKRYDLKNAEQLLDWLLERNREMGERYFKANETWEKGLEIENVIDGRDPPRKFSKRVMDKAFENKFFLGLDDTWLH